MRMERTLDRPSLLPAGRSSPEEIGRVRAIFDQIPLLRETLNAMPLFVMILTERREIVWANLALTQALGKPLAALSGRRPGDVLGCARAKLESGCGTTKFCGVCGAGRALLSMQKGLKSDEREFYMIAEASGSDLDLLVRSTALAFGGLRFTMLVASDRSDDTRRRLLEKMFFHDTLNTAGAIRGIADFLPAATGDDLTQCCELLNTSSDHLVEQITSQRDFAKLEHGDYEVKPVPCRLPEFLKAAAGMVSANPAAKGRTIRIESPGEGLEIATDPGLLMRVVGNMLKNAAEAEPRGAAVTLGCGPRDGGGVEIWVQNPSVMPREVQLQLFQRAFSTKGPDRGLGTYSMRMISQRYLGGSVSFRSEPGSGTEFRVALPQAIAPGVNF